MLCLLLIFQFILTNPYLQCFFSVDSMIYEIFLNYGTLKIKNKSKISNDIINKDNLKKY